jgi:hypothetical protein
MRGARLRPTCEPDEDLQQTKLLRESYPFVRAVGNRRGGEGWAHDSALLGNGRHPATVIGRRCGRLDWHLV